MSKRLSRSNAISLLIAIPVSAALGAKALAADTAAVAKQKKSLGYVAKSATAGQTCQNCQLFKATTGGNGTCTIIPGGTVAAAGWCKSWVS
jgi:hypothetical protein